MSRLKELIGKGKKYMIGGVEIEFKPFRLDELEKFQINDKATAQEQLVQSKTLIREFLKKAVPDATDEEIDGMSMEHLPTLMNIIKEMHNLQDGK